MIEQLIDRLAAEAKTDGRRMVERAMEEIDRQLAFARRSRGQKRRFEKRRQEASRA